MQEIKMKSGLVRKVGDGEAKSLVESGDADYVAVAEPIAEPIAELIAAKTKSSKKK